MTKIGRNEQQAAENVSQKLYGAKFVKPCSEHQKHYLLSPDGETLELPSNLQRDTVCRTIEKDENAVLFSAADTVV